MSQKQEAVASLYTAAAAGQFDHFLLKENSARGFSPLLTDSLWVEFLVNNPVSPLASTGSSALRCYQPAPLVVTKSGWSDLKVTEENRTSSLSNIFYHAFPPSDT